MRYRRVKRDANHASIVDALKTIGASVVDLAPMGSGCPDLLVGHQGRNVLLEVKNPNRVAKDGSLRKKGALHATVADKQAKFRDAWRGPIATVDSIEAAIREVCR